jgi:hypothetical protein
VAFLAGAEKRETDFLSERRQYTLSGVEDRAQKQRQTTTFSSSSTQEGDADVYEIGEDLDYAYPFEEE